MKKKFLIAAMFMLSNSAYSDTKNSNIDSFLITSDPQMVCGSNCDLSDWDTYWNVVNQYKMFSREYPDVKAVFINGDLTEYGHSIEWTHFKTALLGLNIPYYYGLGNHDFINNLNDCYENNCAIRSFNNLYNHVQSKKNIVSFDAKKNIDYEFPTIVNRLKGSFSYSVDFGDVFMIQLNDLYDKEYNIDEYSSLNGAKRHIIERTPDINHSWLREQLKKARKEGKIIIVNMHRYQSSVKITLNEFDVKLIFTGHYHDNLGGYSGNFSSGSSAKGTYLKLDIDSKNKTAKIFKAKDNSTDLTFVADIDLESNYVDNEVEEIKPKNKFIRVKNNGGYESFVWVKYQLKSGEIITKKSKKLLLGNVFEIKDIPHDSKNISIVAKNNTGLLWEPQRNIFNIDNVNSNTCIDTSGTTLNSNWKYVTCQ
ncbi:TPA: metallophosphoesterase family protein [Photobacterium damselae]